MGTETDPLKFVGNAPKVSLQGTAENCFGFYLTKEGRNFLRILFVGFKRRTGFGEGKVASIISDPVSTQAAQDREVDRLKNALKRWAKKNQAELDGKDHKRNERLLARLEVEMMAVEDIRKVLSDVAQTEIKIQMGLSFSKFIHRRDNSDMHQAVKAWSSGLCRTFQTHVLENQPNFSREEVPEDQALKNSTVISKREYYRFSPVKGYAFLLAQKFLLDLSFGSYHEAENQTSISLLMNGFALPDRHGTLHLFLTSRGPVHGRIHEMFVPSHHRNTPLEAWCESSPERLGWIKNVLPEPDRQHTLVTENRVAWNPIAINPFVDKLEKTLKHSEWNLL